MYDCPDKKFYPLSKKLICEDMKLTTISSVLNVLKAIGESDENEIVLSDEQIKKSRICIDEMLRRG